MTNDMDELAHTLGCALLQRRWCVATAESCTGGGVAQAMTRIAGCSAWFERGFVTYSNQSKQDMLGVKQDTLEAVGAVSEEVAIQMAEGALKFSKAQVSVAITGIAGPDGGSEDKPVGVVWMAWAGHDLTTKSIKYQLVGDRWAIQKQAVEHALKGLIKCVSRST